MRTAVWLGVAAVLGVVAFVVWRRMSQGSFGENVQSGRLGEQPAASGSLVDRMRSDAGDVGRYAGLVDIGDAWRAAGQQSISTATSRLGSGLPSGVVLTVG